MYHQPVNTPAGQQISGSQRYELEIAAQGWVKRIVIAFQNASHIMVEFRRCCSFLLFCAIQTTPRRESMKTGQ